MIFSPLFVSRYICGILLSFVPFPLYVTSSPNTSSMHKSLAIMFFSAVPVSLAAMICSFLSLSATLSMNLYTPTVVLPAYVVPSRNSTGAWHFIKALYFFENNNSDMINLLSFALSTHQA